MGRFQIENRWRRNGYRKILLLLMAVLPAWWGAASAASVEQLPVVDGKKVVASVDGEPIFWDEFQRALTLSHAETLTDPKRKMDGDLSASGVDFSRILQRMIDVRLILREAGNMGLDNLPEVKSAVEAHGRQTLAEMLLQRHVEKLQVDNEEVLSAYLREAREWKLRPAHFKRRETAEAIAARLADGADFEKEIQQAAAADLATVDEEGRYLKRSEMQGAVQAALSDLAVGEISPVISLGSEGVVLFQLQAVREPDLEQTDPELMQTVRNRLLLDKRREAARNYERQLQERYATVNEDLLHSLDFEAETPGVEAMRKDNRVLARIEGEPPVTVSDLTRKLEEKFYHGFDQAVASKRVNSRKEEVFHAMLEERILIQEARRRGLDKTGEYARRVEEFENALVFGTFVDKAVAPDVKIRPEELQRYYADHSEEFASPKMVRIQSLVFRNRDSAQEAVEKLSAGTDFEWYSANAEGLLPANTPGVIRFDGSLVTVRSLDEEIQESIRGAETGEYRLYSDEQIGYHYVLRLKQVIASRVQALEAVTDEIVPVLYQRKIKEAIGEWSRQLSRHYPVKIYLTSGE